MKINVTELIQATEILLQALKERNGNEVEVNRDHYWQIPEKEMYNPTEYPDLENLTLGQVSSDMEYTTGLLKDPDPVFLHLEKLGYLLIALSYEQNMLEYREEI